MPVLRKEPFSHPDWLFELKWDGFRALAFIERGDCRLVSKNGNAFKSFLSLTRALPKEVRATSAVLDGEIVCLDKDGRSQFTDLMFPRGEPRFYAFDILQCDGQDQRFLQLVDRKQRLRTVMPRHGERLLYVDHLARDGEILFLIRADDGHGRDRCEAEARPLSPGHGVMVQDQKPGILTVGRAGKVFRAGARYPPRPLRLGWMRVCGGETSDHLPLKGCVGGCSARGLCSSRVVVGLALFVFIERSGREIDMFDLLLDRLRVKLFIRRLRVIGHL